MHNYALAYTHVCECVHVRTCTFILVTDPCDGCVRNSTCGPQPDGNVVCTCPPGYNGTNCDNFIGLCHSDPCMNGGTCEETVGNFNYRCNCRPDFTGRNCSTRFNDCLSDPCQNNATCVDMFANYSCRCPEGFTGVNCETLVDQCDPNPCVNNGACPSVINKNCSSEGS